MSSLIPDSNMLIEMVWKSAPILTKDMHKGDCGRIGIVGGSLEYTGAPFFAAMAALRIGADGIHVFCMKDAAIPIKSYSPELIVHPVLDSADPINEILEFIPRLHALVVGPGLGRRPQIFSTLGHIIQIAKDRNLPIILDADALYYLNDNYDSIQGYEKAVLTPNIVEMARLFRAIIREDLQANQVTPEHVSKVANKLGVTIMCKGTNDIICCQNKILLCDTPGTLRRCMGQGDVLSGAAAVMLNWVLSKGQSCGEIPLTALAAWGACDITRRAAAKAYEKRGRSMLTTDILETIGEVSVEMSELGMK